MAIPRLRPMMTVDVFTDTPYVGNPVAVVLDGTGLDTQRMLAFTSWTRLSEATFVLPPSAQERAQGADYAVRIFSPAGEMDFAGHPTLGTCHAWLAHGGRPQSTEYVVQACKAGLIPLRPSAQGWAFAAPLARQRPLPEHMPEILAALGLQAKDIHASALLDVGAPWLCLQLDSLALLRALQPGSSQLQALTPWFTDDVGLGLCALTGNPSAPLEVRAFMLNGEEDPVTGSLNAALAQWLTQRQVLHAPYVAEQGRGAGRHGVVHITQDAAGQLWVGGRSVGCVQGHVFL